jgi:4-hydroxy-2-oxoheptanedioate aldolase
MADYPTTANAQICLIAQIETGEAIENIEAIAAVDGIDALFIGPSDLGCDMGYAMTWVPTRCGRRWKRPSRGIAATGKAAGVFAGPDRTAQMIERGRAALGTGSDAGLLTAAMQAHARSPS